MKLKDIGIVLLLTLAAFVVNVAAAFGWVWIYSQFAPGQGEAAYQAYAQRVAPLCSIIFGAPILFAAGWLAGRGREAGPAMMMGLAVGGLYVGIDLGIMLAVQAPKDIWLWALISWITKILFARLGGAVAARRA